MARPARTAGFLRGRVASLHVVGAFGPARLSARQPPVPEPARRQRAERTATGAGSPARDPARPPSARRLMRGLITASFDEGAKARLARHMEVVHEDWKVRKTIHFDGAQFAAHIRELGADVLIVEADLVHAEVLEGCRLRMIGCCRGDPVNIDLALATEKGIPVFHTPGRNADAVADLTLAFLLMLARHLGPLRDTFRQGRGPPITGAGDFVAMYNRFTGVELGGRTVGLVALGAVGREVAARLVAFKARVLAYDPYVKAAPPVVT